jgi:hypothetical protein
MSPQEIGLAIGGMLASFAGGYKAKRSKNGYDHTQNGNGHFKEAWAKTVDQRLDVLGSKMDALQDNITDLRIDLGAKR